MGTPSWFKKLFQTSSISSDSELQVYFEDRLVGNLKFEDGKYIFKYSRDCPMELRIKGLDSDVIKTSHLHPFFATRLPSKTRPEISEALKELGTEDPILILGNLSSKSAISPYKFFLKTS